MRQVNGQREQGEVKEEVSRRVERKGGSGVQEGGIRVSSGRRRRSKLLRPRMGSVDRTGLAVPRGFVWPVRTTSSERRALRKDGRIGEPLGVDRTLLARSCGVDEVSRLDRLVGMRTKRGKRGRAQAMLEEALRVLRHRGVRRPRQARLRALDRVTPLVESRSRLRAGARRAVPVPVTPRRRAGRGRRRLLEASAGRKAGGRGERRAREVRSLLLGRGAALRRRRERHKAALTNRSNLRRLGIRKGGRRA